MKFDPEKHHRQSIRLRGYDYSQSGAYFITVCTWQRECQFGEIRNGEMVLNDVGIIVANEWLKTPLLRPAIALDEWVVMPNHFHAIVIIGNEPVGATCGRPDTMIIAKHNKGDRRSPLQGPKPASVSSIMAGFKSSVTGRIHQHLGNQGTPIWQRNYWERIIRAEEEYQALCEYIQRNPAQWQQDSLYSA